METKGQDKGENKTRLFARRALEQVGVLRHTAEGTLLNVTKLRETGDGELSMMRTVGKDTMARIGALREAVRWTEKA